MGSVVILALAACFPAEHPAVAKDRLEDFTKTVFEATAFLRDNHVKKVPRAELVRWAIEGLYGGSILPDPLAARLRDLERLKDSEMATLLSDARNHLGERKELADLKDIDLALEGIFNHLEPEMKQVPQAEARRGFITVCGQPFVSIGVRLEPDPKSRCVRVVTTLMDGPAYQAGVLADDRIVSLADEVDSAEKVELRRVMTNGLTLAQVERALRGRAGSKVKLTIRRPGTERALDIEVIRREVEPETVLGARRKVDDRWDFTLDPARKIGYVRIRAFGKSTPLDMDRALADLEKCGTKGLIIDLRFNSGGLIKSACEVAERFVADGVLVTVTGRGNSATYTALNEGKRTGLPVVCLVNGETRRVSEVVAACLQDHRRAIIVGERTAGNVGVRNQINLNDGFIRFTTSVMGRPSGKNLSKLMTSGKPEEEWGVSPDSGVEVKLPTAKRAALLEYWRRQDIIPRPGSPGAPIPSGFGDRQLERAVVRLSGE